MDSDPPTDSIFKEFRTLESKHTSREQHLVLFFHIIAAILISVIQLSEGFTTWSLGFGIVVPILLILHGFIYRIWSNDPWYREQMVPFMSSIVTTTEIETDRYLQYHRRFGRFILIFGWPAILLCQIVWRFGLTEIMPAFVSDDIFIRLIGEVVAYVVLFGPFLLYILLIAVIAAILERFMLSRYKDIQYLIDIENKWNVENRRRAKTAASLKKKDVPTDN
jgi:hypothetical protein